MEIVVHGNNKIQITNGEKKEIKIEVTFHIF